MTLACYRHNILIENKYFETKAKSWFDIFSASWNIAKYIIWDIEVKLFKVFYKGFGEYILCQTGLVSVVKMLKFFRGSAH